ncbi:S-layer homology domain-containing protein [Paenibacillus macquariensis]|uniref:S-layer homology domain-containing protein n=1 Tax=Paenibacillus macquariensis TaxID=948756 RepID=A0ABY1JNA7_9BACL|nr:S-layer homology domain-containing protein [Paenibacillus macquariensis]MEC0092200.1 S-layer homology domain-containing protein [Paenibacillus macquariensis]OAB37251.1 amylopullulanase [Paenibacillus macquariensis subsp. macquariensis]SIQ49088.1 S-layer homology domain-containing protein [Paenibacillus macquariensis]
MKIQKTLATLTVASILSLSLGGLIYAADNTFTDIESIPGKDKIIALHEQGFINGVTATEFRPDAIVTNAEAIQFITKGLQLNLRTMKFIKAPQASDNFTHVKNDAWFAEAFINAFYNNIDLPKDIEPSKSITKEQFTYYLLKGVEKVGNLPMINLVQVAITDEDEITAMYQGAIQRSLKWNINTLTSGAKFNPKSEITRSEAAVMIFNVLQYLKTNSIDSINPLNNK